jgi:hypothetical protein
MCIFIGSKSVVPFKRGVNRKLVEGGFCVTLSITDSPSDGMYQAIQHPAVFKTEFDAQRLLDRIAKAQYKINLSNWMISDHPCDAWQREQEDNPLPYCPLPVWF